jgi:hypothetical protein
VTLAQRSVAITALALLVGCDEQAPTYSIRYELAIPAGRRAEAAAWVQRTVEVANPHSDEEPEDNIAQAESTADRLFGVMVPHLVIDEHGGRWRMVQAADLLPRDRAIFDRLVAAPAAEAKP